MNIYEYQRLVGKIEDIPELKQEFIVLYDTKSHREMVQFCLIFGQHLIDLTGFEPCREIKEAFEAMQRWLDGKTNYHEARNLSLEISRIAKLEKDLVKVKFLRTMAQIAASPHTKYHGLWATDFAVTLINKMFPDDREEVIKERKAQINLLKNL
ncbi:hypothetical protein BWI96_16860 [Siphonobacter sp. SORGH_AS_0500]|uniref:putative immunity protein n=1 Tax=Siphonobacter sp. SORGH_AS_0500 TaxID=1864824 RepID=UPI000CC35E3D|nr:hypothetical protein [Siphonobacter sp. SORGH_AS_0500]PKK35387.1 hypothetical protein BWI96_16860 [Siphonobacter sp. SORGH_AS_0500]